MAEILSKKEILGLVSGLRQNFKANNDLRAINPLACHIQYPKIPSVLSESMVFHLIQDKRILLNLNISEIIPDHNIADLVLDTSDGIKKVEIKSTGKNAFQYFGEKDIKADYLIWLHFDESFTDGKIDSFEVILIKDPSRYFPHPKEVILEKVKRIAIDCEVSILSIKDL